MCAYHLHFQSFSSEFLPVNWSCKNRFFFLILSYWILNDRTNFVVSMLLARKQMWDVWGHIPKPNGAGITPRSHRSLVRCRRRRRWGWKHRRTFRRFGAWHRRRDGNRPKKQGSPQKGTCFSPVIIHLATFINQQISFAQNEMVLKFQKNILITWEVFWKLVNWFYIDHSS